MHTLIEIEQLTKTYANNRATLKKRVTTLTEKIASIRETLMIPVKESIIATNDARALLHVAVDLSRPLFTKPKSQTFHDVQVGLAKGRGGMVIDDEENTLELIAKHFPKRLDELAPATRKLSKNALSSLTADELKKIGVEIEGAGDVVIIRPKTTDVEKAVKALLKDTPES